MPSKPTYQLPRYPAVIPSAVTTGQPEHHRILIAGGGLSGLTLAALLAQLGVACVLLDEDNTVGVQGAASRGICYTQKSLEIFDKLGIYEQIASKGVQWSIGRTFAGDDEVYSFDLKTQSQFNLSEQPPFINIQQFYNESYLVDRITALGHAQLRWCNRITALDIQPKNARLTIETPQGSYQASADYIIDCTGSRSPFHTWLAVSQTRLRREDRWCIADVRFNTRPPLERHTWIEAPFNDGRAVWQHLMADDVWRIDYQMPADADPEYISKEEVVRERLARQFGQDTSVDIVWVGPYTYRSQCVDQMIHTIGQSQLIFMGDAAKVVSPFGARGGNSGIADADNLAWKLAAVTQGFAEPSLISSYHTERHEAARSNVQVTNRTVRFLRPQTSMEQIMRQATLDLAKKYPFARSLVNTGRMAVANPYSRSPLTTAPLAQSHSIQNVNFCWADGSTARLSQLLQWAQGTPLLLVWQSALSARLWHRLLQRARWPQHPCRIILVAPSCAQAASSPALETVVDIHSHLQQACEFETPPGWALIRPDSYLAARGDQLSLQLHPNLSDIDCSLNRLWSQSS